MSNVVGGKAIASGGFGCVFVPALKCKGETKRKHDNVSKLMTERHANEEYEEIVAIKSKLNKIKNFENYFLINDVTICKPGPLTNKDLTSYSKTCSSLTKKKITKSNINDNLDKLMSLNIPNGGLPVDDFLYGSGSLEKMYNVHNSLVLLLKKGIVPMNKKNIYHCDIKDSNILVEHKREKLTSRLIDWGLTAQYVPFENNIFPNTWLNRPLQFNVPFSVIIFTSSFVEKYTKYLKNGGLLEEALLRPFVIDYINYWMKERGAGHYKFINEIMFSLFSNTLTSIPEDSKPQVIETQITMDLIINYIVDVLVHFTRFKTDGTLNLREYVDNIFIQIVDVWGLISAYYPMIELLSNNYFNLNNIELKIFNQLQFIFVEYLYTARHEPIDMDMLYTDLKILGNLIHISYKGKRKTRQITTKSRTKSSTKSSTKSRKKSRKENTNNTKTNISFKRGSPPRRFKNPVFLSIK